MIRNLLLEQYNCEKTAVIDGEKNYTYKELARKAFALTSTLKGIVRENIALFLPNGFEYMAAFFGVLMSGNIVFPINTRLKIEEIISYLEYTEVKTLLSVKKYSSFFSSYDTDNSLLQILFMEDIIPYGDNIMPETVNIDPDETMILLGTSGTTGNTKIVRLSERNVAFSTFAYIEKMDFENVPVDGCRLIFAAPFFSAYGLLILTAWIKKAYTFVIIDDVFTLDSLFKAAEKYKVTHLEGGVSIGLQMQSLIGKKLNYDISTLKYYGLAGSKLSAETLLSLSKAYPGVEFWPGYGMSEAGPLIAKPDKKVNLNKPNSVGTAIKGIKIMVDVGGELSSEPYVRGEIVVCGANVMQAYYKNEEATRKALKNGCLYTGDIGYFDEDGDLYISGRIKNIIIVRGFNVHAEEIEERILSSGLVADCHIYGEADESGDELICADIIPICDIVGIDDIKTWCYEHITDYKRPRKINFVRKIEKTATGKTAHRKD